MMFRSIIEKKNILVSNKIDISFTFLAYTHKLAPSNNLKTNKQTKKLN